MFDIFDAITWVIEQIRSGWQGLRTAFQDALSPFLSIIRLLKHDVQMAANERGEAAGGIVASATVLIVSLVTAVATSGGTLAFLAGIPRQLRAIAARIVKSVEQAGSNLKLAFSKIRPVKVDDALETIAEQKRTLAEGDGDEPIVSPPKPISHPEILYQKALPNNSHGAYQRFATGADLETYYGLSSRKIVGIDGVEPNYIICAKKFGDLTGEFDKRHASHFGNEYLYHRVLASFKSQSKKLLEFVNESSRDYVLYGVCTQGAAEHYLEVLRTQCGPEVAAAVSFGRMSVEYYPASVSLIDQYS